MFSFNCIFYDIIMESSKVSFNIKEKLRNKRLFDNNGIMNCEKAYMYLKDLLKKYIDKNQKNYIERI